jgi:hypothetical protein
MIRLLNRRIQDLWHDGIETNFCSEQKQTGLFPCRKRRFPLE